MSVRRLIISDLHFGSGDDLLARPAALERIASSPSSRGPTCGASTTSPATTTTTSSPSRATSGACAAAPSVAGVPPAARLLRALCPATDVVTAYPACVLDGMAFLHGHDIDAHASSSDRWLMDGLAWQLTGTARPGRVTTEDYEALTAPLYELMYEIANLPSGRRAQQRFERSCTG